MPPCLFQTSLSLPLAFGLLSLQFVELDDEVVDILQVGHLVYSAKGLHQGQLRHKHSVDVELVLSLEKGHPSRLVVAMVHQVKVVLPVIGNHTGDTRMLVLLHPLPN